MMNFHIAVLRIVTTCSIQNRNTSRSKTVLPSSG